MITLQTNRLNFFGRLVMLPCLILLACLIIKNGIIDSPSSKGIFLLYFLIALLAYLFFMILFGFFGIIKVHISISTSQIKLISIFSSKDINLTNVIGYYNTYVTTRRRIYNGLLIKLEDGSVFELIEYNLVDISEMENLLIESNKKCFGKKKSYFPFTRKF